MPKWGNLVNRRRRIRLGWNGVLLSKRAETKFVFCFFEKKKKRRKENSEKHKLKEWN